MTRGILQPLYRPLPSSHSSVRGGWRIQRDAAESAGRSRSPRTYRCRSGETHLRMWGEGKESASSVRLHMSEYCLDWEERGHVPSALAKRLASIGSDLQLVAMLLIRFIRRILSTSLRLNGNVRSIFLVAMATSTPCYCQADSSGCCIAAARVNLLSTWVQMCMNCEVFGRGYFRGRKVWNSNETTRSCVAAAATCYS